jgi:hypothetical protein
MPCSPNTSSQSNAHGNMQLGGHARALRQQLASDSKVQSAMRPRKLLSRQNHLFFCLTAVSRNGLHTGCICVLCVLCVLCVVVLFPVVEGPCKRYVMALHVCQATTASRGRRRSVSKGPGGRPHEQNGEVPRMDGSAGRTHTTRTAHTFSLTFYARARVCVLNLCRSMRSMRRDLCLCVCVCVCVCLCVCIRGLVLSRSVIFTAALFFCKRSIQLKSKGNDQ